MAYSVNKLINDALLQTGMIPQENANIPAYMTDQAFILLNDIILMWGSDQSLAPYAAELNFNFVANQERYTFGVGDQYDVNASPMIDISSFVYNIQTGGGAPLMYTVEAMTEVQYQNILYRGINAYPSQYLMRLYPEYTEVIVQPLPQLSFPVQIMVKSRLPIVSLYQNLENLFPPGYLLCLKYQLMLDICDAFSFDIGASFIAKATAAIKQMRGNNKMDIYSRKSERMRGSTQRTGQQWQWWGPLP